MLTCKGFCAVSNDEVVTRELIEMSLRRQPVVLLELLKKMPILPTNSHRPLIAFVESLLWIEVDRVAFPPHIR